MVKNLGIVASLHAKQSKLFWVELFWECGAGCEGFYCVSFCYHWFWHVFQYSL